MLVAIALSVAVALITSVTWVSILDRDIGEYEYCYGCMEVECNECPKSEGCGKNIRENKV